MTTAEPSISASTVDAPLRLPVSTRVSDALATLVRAGEEMALVTHRGLDVGVVTIDDLAADGPADLRTVGDVMTREVVRIDPTTDLERTLRIYTRAGWSSAIRRHPGQPKA